MKIFDCHCDTITEAYFKNFEMYENNLHIDFLRLKNFEKAIQVFAIWLDKKHHDLAFEKTLKSIDFFKAQIEKNKDIISLNIEEKNISAIMSIEGGEAIESSLEKLEFLYEKGVKLMTLTWNYKNSIGSGALSGFNDGLTEFGKKVIKKMNELNMLIDVSHLNDKGFFDVFNLTTKPFIASHSNCRSVFDFPRNLSDDQLRAIKESSSIVGINLYPDFIDGEYGEIDNILRHIDHIMNKVSEKAVGLGCDFDGISRTPKEISNISEIYVLYDRVKNVWGEDIANKLFFENMYNFWLENNFCWN